MYYSLLYLINCPYAYAVLAAQSTTSCVDLILSNFIVTSISLTRSLFKLTYAVATVDGLSPVLVPPVKVTVGVVV